MGEATLDAVAQRVERLERENRRLKGLGLLGLLGLVTIALMGQAASKDRGIVARAIEIRDGQGTVHARLSGSTLELYGDNGRSVLTLHAGEYGPSMSLSDENGQVRLVLGVMPSAETPIYTPEQRPGPSLVMFGTDGRAVWKAP